MRIDWFISSVSQTPSDAMDDAVAERLAEDAESFLRSSGTLSWAEWQGLADKSREIFAEAGDRIRAEFAGMIGAACTDAGVADALMTGRDLDDEAARRYCLAGITALEAKLAQEVRG